MSDIENLHRKWMKDPRYKKAHEELASEFELARAVIQARANAGLTQEELAKRMKTTQSVIARLESGRTKPSTQTLERLAAATGTRVKITFEPIPCSMSCSLVLRLQKTWNTPIYGKHSLFYVFYVFQVYMRT